MKDTIFLIASLSVTEVMYDHAKTYIGRLQAIIDEIEAERREEMMQARLAEIY